MKRARDDGCEGSQMNRRLAAHRIHELEQAQSAKQQDLVFKDALAYVEEMKKTFHDKAEKKSVQFVQYLRDFRAQRIDMNELIIRIEELFKGHHKLVLEFISFLVEQYDHEITSALPLEDDRDANEDDLFSKLPNELLVEILSLLPTVDAIKTGFLSRRWRNLWKDVHNIDISAGKACLLKYFESADCHMLSNTITLDLVRLLTSFRSCKVFKLHIELPFVETMVPCAIHACVEFAIQHHVEDLTLSDLNCRDQDSNDFYNWYKPQIIPGRVFDISSLVKLNLAFCHVKLPPLMCLPLLTSLVLDNTDITFAEAEELISNCPSLENLRIKGIQMVETVGNVRVHIKNPTLRSLYVDLHWPVTFSTPALESLELGVQCSYASNIDGGHVFEDVSSLVKCVLYADAIGVKYYFCPPKNSTRSLFQRKMLSDLQHVKILHLGKKFIQNLPSLAPSEPIKLDCTCVTLEMSFICYSELCEIASILASSPRIEKLKLMLKENYWRFVAAKRWTPLRKSFRTMKQLKEAEIQYGFDHELGPEITDALIQNTFRRRVELVKLVLKNSMNLKALTVRLDHKSLEYAPSHLYDKLLADMQSIRSRSNAVINLRC